MENPSISFSGEGHTAYALAPEDMRYFTRDEEEEHRRPEVQPQDPEVARKLRTEHCALQQNIQAFSSIAGHQPA
jgi:hypothetical protein